MTLPDKLGEKKASVLKTNRVLIGANQEKVYMISDKNSMAFMDMMKLRTPQDSNKLKKEIYSKQGHIFANLGLSIILTTTYNKRDYLILVRQDRPDFNDSVAKFISGYIYSYAIDNPIKALEEEISEEFLPCTADGKILSGMRKLKPLKTPFKDVVEYEQEIAYQIIESDLFKVPNTTKQKVFMNKKELKEGNAFVCYHAPTNSAQIIFNYHVDIPSLPEKGWYIWHAETNYLKQNKASLNHTEDQFRPKDDALDVMIKKQGLLLVKLESDNLTNEVFTYDNGSLKKFEQPITLSEAFASKDQGIINVNNILLNDYLKK